MKKYHPDFMRFTKNIKPGEVGFLRVNIEVGFLLSLNCKQNPPTKVGGLYFG